MLEDGLRHLSKESVQRRFLTPKSSFSRSELRYLTEVDGRDHVALVAEENIRAHSAEPHRGCGKFAARFGVDALKFVNSAVGRELNLRGVNARIVEGGVVRAGESIRRAPG